VAEAPDATTTGLSERLAELGRTVAVAESLTGGQLSARLASAPGSGHWYRGAVVAYATEVKRKLLGVPAVPAVSMPAAAAMAEGACRALDADIGLSVTGVAGPDPQDGSPPGTVWVGLRLDGTTRTRCLDLPGTPAQIVDATCDCALQWLLDEIGSVVSPPPEGPG
jgi:nicotinamide-nucleotide amidase